MYIFSSAFRVLGSVILGFGRFSGSGGLGVWELGGQGFGVQGVRLRGSKPCRDHAVS